MILRTAIAAAIFTSMTWAYAGSLPVPRLSSCVGTYYQPLKNELPSPTSPGNTVCLTDDKLRVCRRLLNEDRSDNETTEVVVESNGQVIQRWKEANDPSYLHQIYALRANKSSALLVVATQQSESQGMGIQEWSVNVIEPDKHLRHTYATTEFGPKGSLVLDKSTPKSCKLLSTRWETLTTNRGDRLFLFGQLIDLDSGAAVGSPFRKRFDQKLKLKRESAPEDRPMQYFQQ